jgi:class 3 adenylate cyclase/tetratricopeptide (TPR) repeat protein
VSSTAKFCSACGKSLVAPASPSAITRFTAPQAYTPRHLAEKILTHRSALQGERKQVTVLFCDLANSMVLADHLGPEAMHALLNHFFELSLHEIHRYEGTINQFLGDGFMALFGAPIAYEDHAPRAILAAVGLRRRIRERLPELVHASSVEFAIRMGLNTGLVVVGKIGDNLRMDYTAVGDTTNLAARLQQLADPGTILVSKTTAQLVKSHVYLEALGTLQVKGKTAPVIVYKVTDRRPRRAPWERFQERPLSRFVGRQQELATLEELLAKVEAGEGQVVGIVGEAGVGKTRLLYEFRQRLAGKRLTYLEGYCLSYGHTVPYLPVIDIVRNNCGIAETDSPELITEKVVLSLREVGMGPEEWSPYVLHLLGVKSAHESLASLSPEAIMSRTFTTLRQMSLHGSRRRPIIFAVEDLHWSDQTSEACFATLVESLVGAPILFLSTYRPGYRPPWIDKSYATQIALPHLPPQDSMAVIYSILPPEKHSEALGRAILAKAAGNPFFLEELARVAAEHEDVHTIDAVPSTVQGILMARIDQLGDAPKRLLQTASIFGRDVPLHLLEAIWEDPAALDRHLHELQRQEFLYERIGVDEPTYVFTHPLTQEVAYGSLLTTHRQALHAAAGRALEALYAARLEDVYDRLAYHYARTDEADKAIAYLTRSAEKAARSFAHTEVVAALQEALAHAEHLAAPERHRACLDLVLRQVHSLIFLGRFSETLELLLLHQPRLAQVADPGLAGPYYFWLGLTYGLLGQQQDAGRYAQQALAEAQRDNDEATMGKAYYVLSMEGYWAGRPQQGLQYGAQAVTLLGHTAEPYWLGMAYFYQGLNAYLMGHFTQALALLSQAQEIGDATGNPRLQSVAAWITGWIYATQGDWAAGVALCQQGLERSPDPLNTAGALGYLGTAYLEQGDPARAIPLLEQSIQQWQQFHFPQLQGWFTALLGEAYLLHGDPAHGQALASQGLAITHESQFSYGMGVAQRVLGKVMQARGLCAEAETYLKDALQTFTAMSARFEVGRTHLSLAALAHMQGAPEATSRHLQQAYDLFRLLHVPRYTARTAEQASALGVVLGATPDADS